MALSEASDGHRTEPLRLRPPARDCITHGVAHRVALDPDSTRKVVGDVVSRLGREREPAEPGQQQLLEGARLRGAPTRKFRSRP